MNLQSFEAAPEVTDPPSCTLLEGQGEVVYGGTSAPAEIKLIMVPGRTISLECLCNEEDLVPGFITDLGDLESYRVCGSVDGRNVSCDTLYCTESTTHWSVDDDHWRGVFLPFSSVEFDYPAAREGLRAKSMTCALMTYTGPGFRCQVDDLEFTVNVSRHMSAYQKRARTWNSPVETATLTLLAADPLPPDVLKQKSDDFLLLLSFAQGEQISYYRFEFLFSDGRVSEVWQSRRVWDPTLLSRPLSAPCDKLLQTAYSNFSSWPPEKQQLIRLAIYYHLDAKQAKVMEIITLSEGIAWEMLVREIEKDQALTDDVKDLKKRIKVMYGEWRKAFPSAKDPEHLHSRLHSSLQWMPLREGIEQLVSTLNLSGNSVDPLLLKKFRDSIAHTGRFPDEYPDPQVISNALKGLLELGDEILLKILCPTKP